MLKWLIGVYIRLKYVVSVLFRQIKNSVDVEVEFVKKYFKDENDIYAFICNRNNYVSDKLFNFFDWDWQKDSVNTIMRGGDCNSLHRVLQVWLFGRGYDSYLFSFLAKPFKMSHSFVVYKKNNIWFMNDYGCEVFIGKRIKENLFVINEYLGRVYKSKIVEFVMQDIRFRVVDVE